VTALDLALGPPYMINVAADEKALVEKAKANRGALAALYRKYLPVITAYVTRRVGATHEAEDLVANVFLAMVKNLPRYRHSDAPFAAWLYRIATNEINRSFRKRRIRKFFGLGETIVDESRSAEPHEKLRIALAALPLNYQTALSLHYLEQLSVSEVALVIGVSPGTVKSRLARGRDLLRKKLARSDAS